MKTTMQDLIVGHYEGGLTPGQEQQLQALLATSAEARALYEQHGAMQEVMEEESERLVPPIALREATIGAALGVAAETIGGGIAAWFTTKVAVAIGTVVVGGATAGIILSTTGDDEPKNPVPAVSAPATVGDASVEDVNTRSVDADLVETPSDANAASSAQNTPESDGSRRTMSGKETSDASSKPGTRSDDDPSGANDQFRFGTEPDPAVIQQSPVVTPQQKREE